MGQKLGLVLRSLSPEKFPGLPLDGAAREKVVRRNHRYGIIVLDSESSFQF